MNEGEFMTKRDVAGYLGICLNTLDKSGIPRVKFGRKVMYRRGDVVRWIEENTREEKPAWASK